MHLLLGSYLLFLQKVNSAQLNKLTGKTILSGAHNTTKELEPIDAEFKRSSLKKYFAQDEIN